MDIAVGCITLKRNHSTSVQWWITAILLVALLAGAVVAPVIAMAAQGLGEEPPPPPPQPPSPPEPPPPIPELPLNPPPIPELPLNPPPIPDPPPLPPPSPWVPYGFAFPGDPYYGFGLPDNDTKDFLGLVAKGNIVIGDYTQPDFQKYVVDRLKPGLDTVVQPYAIDKTDVDLGYHDLGFDGKGRPLFSGNYDQQDGGLKLDGQPRKFYESTLSDAEFEQYVDPKLMDIQASGVSIDGVLFTNHALAGLVKAEQLMMNGSVIARDEALTFNKALVVSHDLRLLSDKSSILTLPFSIKRPRLVKWEECPPAGCSNGNGVGGGNNNGNNGNNNNNNGNNGNNGNNNNP